MLAIGTWEEESFYAIRDERLPRMALDASEGFFKLGGEMGSRDQNIFIMALVTRDDRMTQEFGEFY